MLTLTFYVLDTDGNPVVAADPVVYGMGLLDPRRVLGAQRIDIGSGSIFIQTEFIGVDDTGDKRLWQTQVEWASMLGRSRSFTHYTSAPDATDGHVALVRAMTVVRDALVQRGGPA